MISISSAYCRSVLTAGAVLLLMGCATPLSEADSEKYILEGSRQWAESVATGRTEDLERIIAEDFVGTDPQGRRYDKARMLENTREAPQYFSSNQIGPVKSTSLETRRWPRAKRRGLGAVATRSRGALCGPTPGRGGTGDGRSSLRKT